jgi:uncharacterized protein with NRDE domain
LSNLTTEIKQVEHSKNSRVRAATNAEFQQNKKQQKSRGFVQTKFLGSQVQETYQGDKNKQQSIFLEMLQSYYSESAHAHIILMKQLKARCH